MQRDLAINLGENLGHDQARLNRLHFLLIAGILCMAFEAVFWLLTV